MKKYTIIKIITMIFCLSFITPAAAVDEDNFDMYVGGRFVYNALRINGPAEKFDDMNQTTPQFGFGISAGVRQKINILSLRYEVDYNYNMKKISFYHALMLNMYMEARVGDIPLSPYIMAGIGINMFDPPTPHLESGFAYNFGGGILYFLTENWAIDAGIRYMGANINFHVDEGYTLVKNHMFSLGFQYIF